MKPLHSFHCHGALHMLKHRNRCLGLAFMAGLLAAAHAPAQEAPAAAARLREQFQPAVGQPGLGGLPIYAQVSVAENVVDCNILAVVAHPPERVTALLGGARGWCGILLLHPNVKACAGEPAADGERIVLHLGTKHYQPPELSRPQRYDLRIERREEGVWAVRLRPEPAQPAGAGVLIEVVALEGGGSGLRLRYREPLSAGARLLAAAYFATLGRDKVGFSTTGVDAEGRPAYVRGLAGAIERNIVRHFLAIETLLAEPAEGAGVPPERRLAHWFALTERHARQLHELEWAEYLDIKLREFARSAELQGSIDAEAGK